MAKTRVSIAKDVRVPMIALLNQQLADTFDLYSQAKQAQRNLKDSQFIELHLLFHRLAAEAEGYADRIAERATALGGTALGTARMAASASRLEEFPSNAVEGLASVEALADRCAAIGSNTRAAIDAAATRGDAGTADLFTQVSRGLGTSLWFLESQLPS
jgi:starvation-inducible DNA-binding protein